MLIHSREGDAAVTEEEIIYRLTQQIHSILKIIQSRFLTGEIIWKRETTTIDTVVVMVWS